MYPSTEIVASPRKTGLQWLVDMVFPSFLQGFFGRWLMSKLFEKLRDADVLPAKFFKWLHRRRPAAEFLPKKSKGLRTAEVYDFIITPEVRAAVLSALEDINPGEEPSAITAVACAKWYFGTAASFMPSEHDIAQVVVEEHLQRTTRTAGRRAITSPLRGTKLPRGLTDEGRDVWAEVIDHYTTQIKGLGGGDAVREWSTALIIYERLCKANGVKPWRDNRSVMGKKTDKNRRRELLRKLTAQKKEAYKQVVKIEHTLEEALGDEDIQFGDDFEYKKPSYNPGTDQYHLSILSPFTMVNGRKFRQDLRKRLEKLGFHTTSGTRMEYRGRKGYRIVYTQARGGGQFKIVMTLRKGEALLLVKNRNIDDLERLLAAYMRNWWRTQGDFK